MEATIIMALLAFAIYFAPGITASIRGHPNAVAITILTLLLGWTFIGWAVALVWACTVVSVPPEHA